MPTTTYYDPTFGVREIGGRTDAAGVDVDDLPLEQDALINAILTEGFLTDGAFQVAADSPATMDVIVGSGVAKADLYVVETDETGRHPYIVRLDDADDTITVDAADASNDRIDEIWLVVRDPGLSGDAGSLALPRLAYRKGDAAASPAAPGPDGGWAASVKLATLTVGAGVSSITAGDIADDRGNAQLADAVQGAGSGLDADTLDGLQAEALAALTGGTFTGAVTFEALATFEAGVEGNLGADVHAAADGPNSWPAGMSWQLVTTGSWPATIGAVFTWNLPGTDARDWQLFIASGSTPVMSFRVGLTGTTWSDWQTVTTAEKPGAWEVDGLTEVASVVLAQSSLEDVATVNLDIPSDWNTWKCQAEATFSGFGGDPDGLVRFRLRIDGTDQQQSVVDAPIGDIRAWSVVGRRTGMSTTGSRSITLRADRSGSASGATLVDLALYARAVRTS